MTETQPRPPAVTMACLFVGLGSLMLLVELFGALSNWGSLEIQGELRKALKSAPLPGLGLEEGLRWLQVGAQVALVLCVAGTVLAFFAARGDKGSRIALTGLCALATLAFISGGLVGLVPALVAALSASALWSPEARAWFGGRPMPVPPQITPGPVAGIDPVRGPMPTEILAGGVVAMVGSLVAGSTIVTNAVAVAARRLAPSEFERILGPGPLLAESTFGVHSTPTSDALVIGGSVVLACVALVGFVLSLMLLLGRARARGPLVAVSYVSAVLTAIAFPIGLVLTVAAFATVTLLNRPAARRWR